MEVVAPILNAIAWPFVALILIWAFRKALSELLARVLQLKASSSGIELILDRLEKEGQLPFGSRSELAGLTAHDIWALESFSNGQISPVVEKLNTAQRVAVRTLCDAKLLAITGEGVDRKVVATTFGEQTLRAASLLL